MKRTILFAMGIITLAIWLTTLNRERISYTLLYCPECKLKMHCTNKNIPFDYGLGHEYIADLYRCPECGKTIYLTDTGRY